MKNIALIFIIAMISSCSSENNIYTKSTNFINHLAKNIPTPWIEINNDESDFALRNNKTKSIFIFNSSCRKHEGSTLDGLTSSLLAGLTDLQITEKKNVFHQQQGRAAMETNASGKLDGISRYLKITTIQKNNCIYDYVLISTNPKNLEIDSADMQIFLERIIIN